jgi:hypothetical protein
MSWLKGNVATKTIGLAIALSSQVLACSSGPPPPAKVVVPDGGPDTGGDAGTFALKPLGCGPAGIQSVAAVSGSTVAFASLSAHPQVVQTCKIMPLGPVEVAMVQLYDVCYAASTGGGDFKTEVVTSQPYIGPTGVGLAFDSTGAPTVAFTGVGSTPPAETCGSNDVFATTLKGGAFTTPVQVSNGSATDALVAAQMGNCSENVCGEGDTTGFWPAIAFDSSDNARIAYRDIHFGFAADDFAKSDCELAIQSGGAYQTLTIDVARGAGDYNRVAFDPQGLPAVLTYNSNMTGMSPGVYLDRQVKPASGAAAQAATGVWTSTQLFVGQIVQQGQLGFGINSKGLYAVAYNDASTNLLMYTEAMDAETWSSPQPVDTIGNTGLYPSLAFDSDGNAAIAYYRCNSVSAMQMSCDPASDGLYLARRSGGSWNISTVSANPDVQDGLYPALAFVEGKPAIAFQEVGYDPISKQSSVSWWVAEAP